MENHGVLEGKQKTDFIAGTIPFENRNPSGNWKPYLPPGEHQSKAYKDTMACVTFSLLNCIETQEKFLTGNSVNYSDRWIALMSGTTPQGNYLYKVADTVRHYGLVKESSWPAPDSFEWGTYYAPPSAAKMEELLAEGREWLKTHTLAWEWISNLEEDMLYHLKQCPLQVVKPGHAIEGFYEASDITHYFDTYEPFEKTIHRTGLTDVLKPVLTIKNTEPMKLVNNNGTYSIEGEKGHIGINQVQFLNVLTLITDKVENRAPQGPQIKIIEPGPQTFIVK